MNLILIKLYNYIIDKVSQIFYTWNFRHISRLSPIFNKKKNFNPFINFSVFFVIQHYFVIFDSYKYLFQSRNKSEFMTDWARFNCQLVARLYSYLNLCLQHMEFPNNLPSQVYLDLYYLLC